MSETIDPKGIAERALAAMRREGFEHAQASASVTRQDELNIAHNEASLLRSTESHTLSLVGLVDGRKAATELSDLGDASIARTVAQLFADAQSAPRDDANAVSADQRADIAQGPQQGDAEQLAGAVRELLAFRERETPKMMIDEAAAAHTLVQSHTVTSGGSDLACRVGWYSVSVFGTAREGSRSSSFNYTAGSSHDLRAAPVSELFGIGQMLRDTEQQIHTQPIGGKFVGDVVLTPPAVADLLRWLHDQIGDVQLIAGSSLYRDRVGTPIASPLVTLRSRFEAPGVVPLSADAFVARPVEVLRAGTLTTLTTSLYGSRKTGLPHVPTAPGGWELAAGDTPRAQLLSGVTRGAVVGRLSMGKPSASGDFSGVIKNSFAISDGIVGPALSETMISGNIARMLLDVIAVSRERIDYGALLLPWLRVAKLHFS